MLLTRRYFLALLVFILVERMYGASALAGAALAGSELPDAKNAKVRETEATADDEWENLLREAGSLGKPAWVHAVEQYYEMTGSKAFLEPFYRAVVQQISWFEKHRKADGEGYYYTDILTHQWESGVDEGIRFREVKTGKSGCVDATSHVYQMYDLTAKWAEIVGQDLSAEPNRTATCVNASYTQRSEQITLRDVAERVGVSHVTISLALPRVRLGQRAGRTAGETARNELGLTVKVGSRLPATPFRGLLADGESASGRVRKVKLK